MRKAYRNTDAGQLFIRIVACEIVVSAAGAYRAYLRMGGHFRLVDRAGVIVKAARYGEIDRKILLRHTEVGEVACHRL